MSKITTTTQMLAKCREFHAWRLELALFNVKNRPSFDEWWNFKEDSMPSLDIAEESRLKWSFVAEWYGLDGIIEAVDRAAEASYFMPHRIARVLQSKERARKVKELRELTHRVENNPFDALTPEEQKFWVETNVIKVKHIKYAVMQ